MPVFEWDTFETLMNISLDENPTKKYDDKISQSELLAKLAQKRTELDKQRKLFHQATNENIKDEYLRLRKAHRDFLAYFNEVKEQYRGVVTD
jgi:hypothetical protein